MQTPNRTDDETVGRSPRRAALTALGAVLATFHAAFTATGMRDDTRGVGRLLAATRGVS